MRYTDHDIYLIDNNPVERGQRPSALGCKSYLFSQNDRGAEDNAILYTFIITCETLGINAYDWLGDTLSRIRPDMPKEKLIALPPLYLQKLNRLETNQAGFFRMDTDRRHLAVGSAWITNCIQTSYFFGASDGRMPSVHTKRPAAELARGANLKICLPGVGPAAELAVWRRFGNVLFRGVYGKSRIRPKSTDLICFKSA